jgi:hypothetical protein
MLKVCSYSLVSVKASTAAWVETLSQVVGPLPGLDTVLTVAFREGWTV